MYQKLRLPGYLSKNVSREIAEMYASVGIADFALAIVSIFEPIFLYNVLHLSIPQILLFNAAVYFFYIILIPFGGKIISRFGYEHGILFSIPFQILFWVLLYAGQDNIKLLFIAPLAYAIEKSLYWPAFHASVARFAKQQQRGREFSILYVIFHVVNIVGPFVGGMLSESFGVRITFVLASAIYTCCFIPLFTTKEVFVPKLYEFRDTWLLYKTIPKKALGYMGFGEELLGMNIWPVFIFVVVEGYEKVGLLVTVATIIATLASLYIGKISDQYSKQMLVKIGSLLLSLSWFFRTVLFAPLSVFGVDSLSRTSKDIVFIPLSTLTYERASKYHIMAYIIFFEQSLAIGKLIAALLGAALFALVVGPLGLSLVAGFVVLFVLAGLFSLLYMLL